MPDSLRNLKFALLRNFSFVSVSRSLLIMIMFFQCMVVRAADIDGSVVCVCTLQYSPWTNRPGASVARVEPRVCRCCALQWHGQVECTDCIVA